MAERLVRRYERLGLPIERDGCEDRVERPEQRVPLEERQAKVEILRSGQQQREGGRVVARERDGVGPRPPSGPNVHELLDDLDRGRRFDPAVAVGRQEAAAGSPQRVLLADRVAEDR
jgi:hypothetical protein